MRLLSVPGETTVCTWRDNSLYLEKLKSVPGETTVCSCSNCCMYLEKLQSAPGDTTICTWRHYYLYLETLLSVRGDTTICTLRHYYLYLETLLSVPGDTTLCTWRHYYLYLETLLSVPGDTTVCTWRHYCLYLETLLSVPGDTTICTWRRYFVHNIAHFSALDRGIRGSNINWIFIISTQIITSQEADPKPYGRDWRETGLGRNGRAQSVTSLLLLLYPFHQFGRNLLGLVHLWLGMVALHVVAHSVLPESTVGTLSTGELLLRYVGVVVSLPLQGCTQ